MGEFDEFSPSILSKKAFNARSNSSGVIVFFDVGFIFIAVSKWKNSKDENS